MISHYNSDDKQSCSSTVKEASLESNTLRVSHYLRNHIKDSCFISSFILICGFAIGALIGLSFDVPLPEELVITEPPSQQWIFQNNSQVALGLCLGGLVFGTITIAILLFNSLLIGLWFQERIRSQGIVMALLLVGPHGIFEIPALMLAGAIGVDIARWTFHSFFSNSSSENDLPEKEEKSSKVFIRRLVIRIIVIEVLLYVASFVEAYLTPLLVGV